jgi:putative salt-induced outer membrane protein YdiY
MKAAYLKIMVLAMLAAGLTVARADVLIFDNGDKLTGKVVSQDADNIRFDNPTLGIIVVPKAQGHVQTAAEAAANAPKDTANNAKGKSPTPPALTLGDRFKMAVNTVVPGQVSGRLDAGVNTTRASSSTTEIMSVGNLTLKNGVNTYDLKGFYFYTATKDDNGVSSRSADRYGSNFNYRRDLDERLFVNDEADYLRDFQANINQQGRDSLSVGYTVWKSGRINLAVQAGPTEQYTDADGVEAKWFTLGTGKQTLTWNITDALRLEQEATAAAQPNDLNSHTWKVSTALINKLDRNLELSLRFSQSYNTLVGTNGVRSEQLLALALGMSF